MNDDSLIGYIAAIWVENGGDRDGFCYCQERIKDKIAEIMSFKVKD